MGYAPRLGRMFYCMGVSLMDMESLMAQAAELQNKVSAAQEKLASMHVSGIADDGACVITMSGKYDLVGLTLRPDVLARGADAVAALVSAAYNDAKAKADALIDDVMGAATAGVPMP